MLGDQHSVMEDGQSLSGIHLLQTVDGDTIQPEELKRPVLLIALLSHNCPASQRYFKRLSELEKQFQSKLQILAVTINPHDELNDMQRVIQEHNWEFPYVRDVSQQIAVRLGANRTPAFYVFDQQRKLAYSGAFDDAITGHVRHQYVADAVRAVLDHSDPPPSTSAVGPIIAWEADHVH
jgi:glutathione peroxidase-family protein